MNKQQRYLKKKYKQTGAAYSGWGPWGYGYDEDKERYYRLKHGPASTFIKKWGNKQIRRHRGVGNHSNYKKITMDWRWEW